MNNFLFKKYVLSLSLFLSAFSMDFCTVQAMEQNEKNDISDLAKSLTNKDFFISVTEKVNSLCHNNKHDKTLETCRNILNKIGGFDYNDNQFNQKIINLLNGCKDAVLKIQEIAGNPIIEEITFAPTCLSVEEKKIKQNNKVDWRVIPDHLNQYFQTKKLLTYLTNQVQNIATKGLESAKIFEKKQSQRNQPIDRITITTNDLHKHLNNVFISPILSPQTPVDTKNILDNVVKNVIPELEIDVITKSELLDKNIYTQYKKTFDENTEAISEIKKLYNDTRIKLESPLSPEVIKTVCKNLQNESTKKVKVIQKNHKGITNLFKNKIQKKPNFFNVKEQYKKIAKPCQDVIENILDFQFLYFNFTCIDDHHVNACLKTFNINADLYQKLCNKMKKTDKKCLVVTKQVEDFLLVLKNLENVTVDEIMQKNIDVMTKETFMCIKKLFKYAKEKVCAATLKLQTDLNTEMTSYGHTQFKNIQQRTPINLLSADDNFVGLPTENTEKITTNNQPSFKYMWKFDETHVFSGGFNPDGGAFDGAHLYKDKFTVVAGNKEADSILLGFWTIDSILNGIEKKASTVFKDKKIVTAALYLFIEMIENEQKKLEQSNTSSSTPYIKTIQNNRQVTFSSTAIKSNNTPLYFKVFTRSQGQNTIGIKSIFPIFVIPNLKVVITSNNCTLVTTNGEIKFQIPSLFFGTINNSTDLDVQLNDITTLDTTETSTNEYKNFVTKITNIFQKKSSINKNKAIEEIIEIDDKNNAIEQPNRYFLNLGMFRYVEVLDQR